MREIDLLPQWYKSGRRRQKGYRVQYAALGVIAAVILILNFVASNSLSNAAAKVAEQTPYKLEAEEFLQEYDAVKNELARLKEKENCLKDAEMKIDVSSVLGELSFLVDERIVLTSFVLSGEPFADKADAESAGGNLVRSARPAAGKSSRQYIGDVRYRVTVAGVAADAAAVAELICFMEDSPYFCQVVPSYSRNRKVESQRASQAGGYAVTDFEVVCCVANYDEPAAGK